MMRNRVRKLIAISFMAVVITAVYSCPASAKNQSAGGPGRVSTAEKTVSSAARTYNTKVDYQSLHASRGDRWDGGDAGKLNYEPFDKSFDYKGTPMPETVKALYLPPYKGAVNGIENYLAIANESDINAFVVDISDNTMIGYPSQVMKKVSPTAYSHASNSKAAYGAMIKAIKDSGYYVIGRITCFHDDYLCVDHPELAISNPDGSLKNVAGGYWPSAYRREVWEYKVNIAKEAVDWFGFDEIQFDYVRFPDRTYKYEQAGTIDFKNALKESKAQAVQRFLMYAVPELHEKGVYVSADVFGETSNDYVAQYGQYWPAISNVVDVISAMPYPDHYASSGDWNPWEHPYDIITTFAKMAVQRQKECPTPAKVRTWIQCYDSIKSPKVIYGAENVGKEIQALYDAGLTGGFMTWHSAAPLSRYRELIPAFDLDP